MDSSPMASSSQNIYDFLSCGLQNQSSITLEAMYFKQQETERNLWLEGLLLKRL